jgi:aspartate/methionine/tyrosine aminotransferase
MTGPDGMTMLPSAFARLRGLLGDLDPPPGRDLVPLHLGEFRRAIPAGHLDALSDAEAWSRYPPLGGTAELRAAYRRWLGRRFGPAVGRREETIAIEPTPGSKQAIAAAVALAAGRDRERDGARASGPPRVILPNPFYPTYLAATEAVGARPVFYPAGPAETEPGGGGGSAAAAIAAALRRAGGQAAAAIVCNPGNPGGEILSTATLRTVRTIAAAAGAVLIVDECYTDLGTTTVPPGFLTVVASDAAQPPGTAAGGGPFLVLHSLSKRSGAPGLRSGFVAGDAATVAEYAAYNRACGVSSPPPVCAAAASLWSDDSHVEARRDELTRIWDLADTILGDLPGYRRAAAGFFLWLPVGDDEQTARRLWRRDGLTVMPGRYLAVADAGGNPGAGHLRVALVHPEEVMAEALSRLRSTLTRPLACPKPVRNR